MKRFAGYLLCLSGLIILAAIISCSSGAMPSSNSSSSSSNTGTPSASLQGVWVCTNTGISEENVYTDEFIFGPASSFTDVQDGFTDLAGTYDFTGSMLNIYSTTSWDMNGASSSDYSTDSLTSFTNGNDLYFAEGIIFKLTSGAGNWSGTYNSTSWDNYNNGGTNIIDSNYTILSVNSTGATVSATTDFTVVNGIATNNYNPYEPAVGAQIPWANTSSDSWHSFQVYFGTLKTFYFIQAGTYLIYSATNDITQTGIQYVKQ